MKKLLIFILALTLSCVGWWYLTKMKTPQKYADGKPAITLRIVDAKGQVPIFITGNQLSLSQEHKLCWATVNMRFDTKVHVVEEFHTPEKMSFAAPDTQVATSPDGKNHLLTTLLDSTNGEYVSRCWAFDNNDPIGKYKVDIQVNDYFFKGLEFEVIK